MAHESFEDEATAAYLNERFVAVKVDREERPDVDAVYMQATQAMTGQGGWPMTCVLDHDATPFFAGTYFPDQARHGLPSFRQVLEALHEAWSERGDDVTRVAGNVREHLQQATSLPPGAVGPAEVAAAVDLVVADVDPRHAGFGGAPKFPPSMVLEALRRADTSEATAVLDATCEAMARGGIYDQIGGGFARYSVDAGWVVPHFEKMLYDNAQLVGLYARWGGPLGERVAAETADFLRRELRTAEGGFASALDADSEGEEGRFYVWTPAQLVEVLGDDDGTWAATVFEVTGEGTFEHGSSVLQLLADPAGPGAARLADVRRRLLEARAARVRPERDDKVVAAWNGLAISGLCDAGRLLGREEYVDAALDAGQLLVDLHLPPDADGPDGHSGPARLLRVSRDGVAGRHAAVLEDLGCAATGFLSLAQVTGDGVWLRRAGVLLDDALARFRADDGGFHDTAVDAETLVARPRDPGDNASPSGFSSLLHALVTHHALSGEGRYRDAAEQALPTVGALIAQAPRFAGWSLAAASAMLDGPPEVAVVGNPGPERDALEVAARRHPGAVVVVGDGRSGGIPLLEGRTPVDGRPAAYVCRAMVCRRPVVTPAELAGELAGS